MDRLLVVLMGVGVIVWGFSGGEDFSTQAGKAAIGCLFGAAFLLGGLAEAEQ